MSSISSKTKVYSVIGHPVSQSFSPKIHNYLFEKYGIDAVYVSYDVDPDHVGEAINGIRHLGIMGTNVTIPHKIEVMKYLDEIDEKAKLFGAVNTIKNVDGKLYGYNTDGTGLTKSLKDASGETMDGKKVLIIGAGGACRSIAIQLAIENAASIEIVNRSIEKAQSIVDTINEHFDTKAIATSKVITQKDIDDVDVLINTTPIGMGTDESPIDTSLVPPKNMIIADAVYKPHETAFIKWGLKHDLKIAYGIQMLINQGVHSFSIWTGVTPTLEDTQNILKIFLEEQKENK
ncbi:MAG: shikimate dehydrogenase [Intestinibacter sp.]|nr:shikimate dehydrogenase [Intestinibacter sp.]MCI6737042.1 shikimate dehydrogenase [Intestinibacter sp.]